MIGCSDIDFLPCNGSCNKLKHVIEPPIAMQPEEAVVGWCISLAICCERDGATADVASHFDDRHRFVHKTWRGCCCGPIQSDRHSRRLVQGAAR
jgi:hypothetical protein